jgi:multiple sugar transport system permease protein
MATQRPSAVVQPRVEPGRFSGLRRRGGPKRDSGAIAYLFILPQVLGFLLFGFLPLLANVVLVFFRWDILTAPEFQGLANVQRLINDAVFWRALFNTVWYSVQYVLPCLVISLGLALLLNQRVRGMAWFRSDYYLPVVTSYVIAAVIWEWMFDANIGLLNQWLAGLGLPPMRWLLDDRFALSSLVLMAIWKNAGYSVLIYLAALQNIPQEYLEAARIDGAGRWQTFFHVTRPLLQPTTFLVAVMLTIWSFQSFAQPYLMTDGGPNRATTTLVYYLYQQGFQFYDFGYAALVATAMTILVFSITVIQRRLMPESAI